MEGNWKALVHVQELQHVKQLDIGRGDHKPIP
jgi:hypothetical protein